MNLGPFRLEKPVASGGMAEVWRARHERSGERVAIKIIGERWARSDDGRAAFGEEVRAVAALHHPHVVRVYDYGALEGEGAYIVMKRLQGATLRTEIRRLQRVPIPDVADWFDQILEGLAAAHAQGIVHPI